MTREQLALKVWNSQTSLAKSAERYGLTRREARELADLGCKLQAQGCVLQTHIPFSEDDLRIIREMAEAGATWREIAEATGRSIGALPKIAKRYGIIKKPAPPEIHWKEGRP